MKLNAPEQCEVIIITLDKFKMPIAWNNRKESLIHIQVSNYKLVERTM